MTEYICTNCRYRFSSAKETRDCPYCGKPKAEKEKSASELLDDVDEMLK